MRLRDFIKENRDEIKEVVKRACPGIERLTSKDLEDWVMNHEGLYVWARRSGVKI